MEGDITLRDFISWRHRWKDLCRLEQIYSHPVAEQTSAFRITLSVSMQQVVEISLGILSGGRESPDDILNRIYAHIRSQRNVALDRVELEECYEAQGESFDEFYIRLTRIAACAMLCDHCLDATYHVRN